MRDAMVRNAAALVESEARYRAVVQSALDAIIVIDQLGHIREFNPAAERVFRWKRAQVMGLDIAEVVIPPDLRDGHRQGFLRHLSTGRTTLLDRRLELVAIRAGGETFPIELTVTRCDDESTPYFTAFIRDLSEQRRLTAAVANHARHDIVTGLDRYAVLEPRLIGMLADAGAFVAVMFVDLDRFHGINEAIGHALGDEVLRSAGARLQTLSGEHVVIGHFASDEFIVVQHGGDGASAELLAENIRNSLAMPFDGHNYRVLLTATIGMSCAPAHGNTALDLLRRAQVAAERGKSLGRDCVCPFLTEDMQDIEDRVAMGGLLRAAAGAGELALHYQPQFATADGRLTGFETLLRWHSPLLGEVAPARFIPIAEALGLMSEIGNWVVREACRQAREWLDAGQRDFTIAVNVSPQQLRRPGLARAVADALHAFRVPGEMIEIELTESSAMENLARVQDELAKLKALGLTLSLDDFGTGYSSLAYLKHFALDKLKIDQSFVRGLPEGELDASIARTIVAVGHDLGLLVAAEGVETAAQAEFLHAIGCDELQGFLLGRPAPATTAASYFDARPAAGAATAPVRVTLPSGVTGARNPTGVAAAQAVARVGTPWWARIGDAVLGTDPRRRIRVAQWLISALVYLGSFAVLWFGMPHDAGYWSLPAWGMFVAVGQIAFYASLRGGWSERFADPGLTSAQIVFGIVAVDWGYLICGPVRGLALFPLLLIFTFGAFSLSWRRMMWLTAFALTSLLATMATLHAAWLGSGSWSLADGDLRMDLTNLLMCMILLPALSLVATRLSILRSKLRAQRAALTGALAEVQRLATRDELTGLANRRHMQERLAEEQHRSARNGHPFSIAVIDLDHFKRINDAHGHARGDEVLRGFATDAGLSLRTCDLMARWGGEEFLLLLPDTGGSQAQASLLRLLARVRSGPRGIGLPLTFSAGVTEHRPGELVSETVARADRQMYEAKRAGRNTVLLQ
jgi:diguanylate cyclase (GGDEF)-like protein/PAS domain S-box-containing protein